MKQLRTMIGSGLAAVLLLVFCVSVRCEVLCALPAMASCECPTTSQHDAAMPGMSMPLQHTMSAPGTGVANLSHVEGVLTRAACGHSVTVPDAEPGVQVFAHSWAQVGSGGGVAQVAASRHRAVGLFATPPPLLRMTPLVQTSALRI